MRYYFFLGILFLAFIAQSKEVLDTTLWPKILVLAVGFLGLLSSNFNYYMVAMRKQSIVALLLLSLLVWTAMSCMWSLSVAESLGDVGKLGVCWLMMLICYEEIKLNPENSAELYKMIAIVLSIVLSIGIFEMQSLDNFSADSMYNITSICGHRNALSSFAFLASIFNILLFFRGSGYWKVMAIVNLIFALFMMVILQTRAVYLAVFLSAVCYAVLYILVYKKWKVALIAAVLILLVISLLLVFKNNPSMPLLHKANVFNYIQSASGAERLKVWDKTWHLITQRPIVGVGAGSWQFLYLKNGWGDLAYLNDTFITFQRPHNDFLWVAAELGLVGFILWISIFLIPVFLGIRTLFSVNDIDAKNIIMVLIAGVVGYLVISFFDFPKERIQHQLLIIALLSILYGYSTIGKKAFFIVPKFFLWLLVFVALTSIYISWQRLKGEHYMTQVYRYRAQQNWAKVIKSTSKINPFFYDTDPTSVPIAWYSGLAYFSMGEYAKAQSDLTKALSISPYNPHLLNNYGSATEMLGNHEEAIKYYQMALNLLPTFDESLLNIAAIYFNENKISQAKSLVLQAKPSDRQREYLNAITQREKK